MLTEGESSFTKLGLFSPADIKHCAHRAHRAVESEGEGEGVSGIGLHAQDNYHDPPTGPRA